MSTITASTASLELARIAELEREVETLRVALAARAGIKEHIERYGNKNKQRFIEEKLQSCADTNSVWLAVHTLLDLHIFDEHMAAHDPALTNEALRYNIGREAGLEYFRSQLLECWAKANKPVKT
jgi:hypothetical protein